jgi:hypothetical protein
MKTSIFIIIATIISITSTAYASDTKYHKTALPDPKSFNAHFGDMDTNSDELVGMDEFEKHFKGANKNIFDALDLNQDGSIDHDEWHEFKEAHGLKHKDHE